MDRDKMIHGYSSLLGQLKAARKNSKLTQVKLADKLNITQPYFSKLESGVQYPSVPLLIRWAKAVSLKNIYIKS